MSTMSKFLCFVLPGHAYSYIYDSCMWMFIRYLKDNIHNWTINFLLPLIPQPASLLVFPTESVVYAENQETTLNTSLF